MKRHVAFLVIALLASVLTLRQCGHIGVDRRDEHGSTALMRAAGAGNVGEVQRLIRRGASVNARVPTRHLRELIAFLSWMQQLPESDIGATPLHFAVAQGQVEVARLLLAKGARADAPDFGGDGPLDRAISRSDTAMVTMLLKAGASVTPLRFVRAVGSSSPQVVALLLEQGADANAVPERAPGSVGPAFPAPLLVAAGRGDTTVVKLLLAAGARTDVRDGNGWTPLRTARERAARGGSRDASGRPPVWARVVALLEAEGATDKAGEQAQALFQGVLASDEEGVRAALSAGANPNARNDRGVPPLVNAAQRGNVAIVQMLVAAGAHVNVNPENATTPLNAAIQQGSVEAVRLLLAAGARVNQPDHIRQTPLQVAAGWKRTEITTLLLAASATVDSTALPLAALAGDADLVRLLLTQGADPNAAGGHALSEATRACYRRDNMPVIQALLDGGARPNLPGLTAIHRAAALCSADVLRLLLSRGADPSLRDRLNGSTPLISAAASGNLENVNVLIRLGVDVNAVNDEKKTALAYAQHYPEIQQLLRAAGAR